MNDNGKLIVDHVFLSVDNKPINFNIDSGHWKCVLK